MRTVWRLQRIWDGEIADESVHATQASAVAKVAAYCRENWSAGRVPGMPSDDDAEILAAYFVHCHNEGADIKELVVVA